MPYRDSVGVTGDRKYKNKYMPKVIWVVKDTTTTLFLTAYNPDPHYCLWGNSGDAITFNTLEDTEPVISTLGDNQRFIGTNPPPH